MEDGNNPIRGRGQSDTNVEAKPSTTGEKSNKVFNHSESRLTCLKTGQNNPDHPIEHPSMSTEPTKTFFALPSDLHLEILRKCELPSLYFMREVNRYFCSLIDSNRNALLYEITKNVTCVGPHSLLLYYMPLLNDPVQYSRWALQTKQEFLHIAQICGLNQEGHIIGLYCLDLFYTQSSITQRKLLGLDTDNESLNEVEGLNLLRRWVNMWSKEMLPCYSTEHLQCMMVTWVRLLFTVADFCGVEYKGQTLDENHRGQLIEWLTLAGPQRILDFVKGDIDALRTEVLGEECEPILQRPLPSEIAKVLRKRGDGLVTTALNQIKEFLEEKNTDVLMYFHENGRQKYVRGVFQDTH